MPKILSYTPAWLSRPSSGSQAFTNYSNSPSDEKSSSPFHGPHRLLAYRGTEIFTVVGNEIRWLDLRKLKHDWEESTDIEARVKDSSDQQLRAASSSYSYRVLNTSVYQQIRQLVVSPSGNFLAILTEHTVHVSILPDLSHLSAQDRGPLKVKTYQLGPTIHVLPQSPVVSALWHPLACSTTSLDCLITVTAEAAVRVWELDRTNLWSFDRPSLAVDLRKLADGTACDEDFEPRSFGKSQGFSVDQAEMEVAAAAFGGHGLEEEDGWSSMTLWTAMRNGDVYALCPLLPSRWRPGSTLVPSLSTSVVSKMAAIDDDSTDADEKHAMQQQLEWVREIDGQEPMTLTAEADPSRLVDARHRPAAPSAIPRLQGPFLFDIEETELDVDISDIQVVAAKFNAEDLLSGEEEDYMDLEGLIQDRLSATVICLATTTGKIHVCLNLEGVSGQWLPKSRKGSFIVPVGEPRNLTLVESLQVGIGEYGPQDWPLFSPDPTAPYDFYLTSSRRIDFFSLSAWASRLESDISSTASPNSGLAFRLKVLCSEDITLTEEILDCSDHLDQASPGYLSNALIMCTPEMGYFLLTNCSTGPHAISFDIPTDSSHALTLARSKGDSSPSDPSKAALELNMSDAEAAMPPARAAYEPSPIFYDGQIARLKELLFPDAQHRRQDALKQDIKLSPQTLDIMTATHRILVSQTSSTEQAAAEVFRRCDRLKEELDDQTRQMVDLSERIQRSDLAPEDQVEDRNSQYERRIASAGDRQQMLNERYETLCRKVGRVSTGGRELSNREKAWAMELSSLDARFSADPPTKEESGTGNRAPDRVDERFQIVRSLSEYLVNESQDLQKTLAAADPNSQTPNSDSPSPRTASSSNDSSQVASPKTPPSRPSSGFAKAVPATVQKSQVDDAMTMLERETAVIGAVMARLERLNV